MTAYNQVNSVHVTEDRSTLKDILLISNVENHRPEPSFLGSGTLEETGAKDLVAGGWYRITVQLGRAKTSTRRTPSTVDFGPGDLRFGGFLRIDLEEAIEAAANPNAVMVVQSGTPVAIPWSDKAKAILHTWYGGNEGGKAIADVVLGAVKPSGKLPLTFPCQLNDNPTYFNYRSEGGRVLYDQDPYVGYRYYEQTEVAALFPFGHGLLYTTFSLSNLKLAVDTQSDCLNVALHRD
ncbi:beta-glucosidase precursor [Stemphylium lycopersici]|uniref:beta-glucosidase n=1 Tax=Stemphylium lycopersici TaxID=183478 RepID=A0A364MX02_STELY|nr:beta-glucosidase precursor [Stemphylium lycopersici]